MLSKEDLLKNKEDLLRNVDELYEACLDELYGNYLRAESERVRQKNMNANLREKITEQGKKLEEANAEITQRDKTITALQNEITRLTEHNEADALRAEITQRDNTITALQGEITRLTEHNEADALRAEITQRDNTITALQEEITQLTEHNEADALRAEITQRDNTITALQNEITQFTEHNESDTLRAEIAQRDETITALQGEITRLTEHNEADALRAEITQRDNTITALQDTITHLTEHNESDALKAEITELRKRLKIFPFSTLQDEFMPAHNEEHIIPTDKANFWKNYLTHHKGTWQNDRYRFYIAYLYESRGWHVYYDDNKRIICHKGRKIIVVCTEDTVDVSRNTIYALIGRALKSKIDNMKHNCEISALCVTSKTLDNKAISIARNFNVAVKTNFPFAHFPYVKCKVLTDGRNVFCTPNDATYLTTFCDTFCDTANDAMQRGFTAV